MYEYFLIGVLLLFVLIILLAAVLMGYLCFLLIRYGENYVDRKMSMWFRK